MTQEAQDRTAGTPDEPPRRTPAMSEPAEESVARGRASTTPFVLLGGMALVIWSIVALVAGGLLLLWWLS
ncbi:MAG: hypothetical protein H0W16_08350 [Actinobacteria bacterium]|nr:hypothetical protein [Actinomycetota bacterium]